MILRDLLQLVLFIGLLAALSPLLGRYVHQVFSGRRTFLHPVLGPVERGVYSLSGIHPDENQTWSRYAVSLIGFSLAGFLLTFGVLLFQDKLPLNPQGFPGLSWDLALNTAVSFLTNTNWQSYGGETTMSHFSQIVALTYQNFVSAAVGIAVCAAVVRGIARNESSSIGNFWSDLVRITLYVLLPLSIIGARRRFRAAPELRKKLPRAEIRHAVTLPLFQPSLDNVLKLAGIVAGRSGVRHVEVRVDDIVYIPQHHSRALLNALRRGEVQFSLPFFHHGLCPAGANDILDLVAADVGEADGCAHMDAVDHPTEPWVPVDAFQQPARCRGRHHIVANAFRFHLRPREAGVIAPDFYLNCH